MSLLSYQLWVRPRLNDLALLEHEYLIGVLYCLYSVSHANHRPAMHHQIQGVLHFHFVGPV